MIAVIPARSGSKRIPRKNIRSFRGKPLIAWSIESALASQVFEAVIVSTDSEEIADISVGFGALVPFLRPIQLSDDLTPTLPVVRHAISELESHGLHSDVVCCIYPAAVFVTPEDYRTAAVLTENLDAQKFVATVTRYAHPLQRALFEGSDSILRPLLPQFVASRSQDLSEFWHDVGQFYVGTRSAWLGADQVLDHVIGIEIPSWRVQDIDTEDDWKRAELIHRALFGDLVAGE